MRDAAERLRDDIAVLGMRVAPIAGGSPVTAQPQARRAAGTDRDARLPSP